MTDTDPPATDDAESTASESAESAPGEDADVLTCTHCGLTFERERYLALHRGLRHADALDDAERAAFEEARERERQELRRFRLKALGALVVLYFGLLMAYAAFG